MPQRLNFNQEEGMKRIIGLMLMVSMLMFSSAGSAAAEQIGIYVAPKFVYGLTQMQSVKGVGTFENEPTFNYPVGSKTDNAFGGSLAIGYDFNKKFNIPIRTELEYAAFSKVEAKKTFGLGEFIGPVASGDPFDEILTRKQSYQIQTLFLNAYYDIYTGTKFTPYVGAGIGMGFIKTKAYSGSVYPENPADNESMWFGSKNVTNFAWNIGAGLGYDITDNVTIDAGYRFVGLGKIHTKTYTDNEWDGVNNWSTMTMKTKNLYQLT